MEEGFIIGPSGIYWSTGTNPMEFPHNLHFHVGPRLGREHLISRRIYSLKAYRCKPCGIIREFENTRI